MMLSKHTHDQFKVSYSSECPSWLFADTSFFKNEFFWENRPSFLIKINLKSVTIHQNATPLSLMHDDSIRCPDLNPK